MSEPRGHHWPRPASPGASAHGLGLYFSSGFLSVLGSSPGPASWMGLGSVLWPCLQPHLLLFLTGPCLSLCFIWDCRCASTRLCLSRSHAARLRLVGEGAVCTVVTSAPGSRPLEEQPCASRCSFTGLQWAHPCY